MDVIGTTCTVAQPLCTGAQVSERIERIDTNACLPRIGWVVTLTL